MIEIIEKKSKFFGYALKVETEEQVKNFIESLKANHKKATHICYAYNIKKTGVFVRAVDDGEPSGTAGRPILNVIEKKNLSDILIVVVRYFGGIKLGAGGLVRAYSKCASKVVEEYLNDNN